MNADVAIVLSVVALVITVLAWVRFVLAEELTESKSTALSTIGFVSVGVAVWNIFVSSGDLTLLLIIGTLLSLLVYLAGLYFVNQEITNQGRGYFWPLVAIFIVRTFLFEPYQIPSGSMMPGLKEGDFILVNKYAYGLKINRTDNPFALASDPDYGDVVVFLEPNSKIPFIKRLIAKPGDRIAYRNKVIYLNGVPLPQEIIEKNQQEYLLKEIFSSSSRTIRITQPQRNDFMDEIIVPEGQYFVMGDNRDNSNDSRYWGFVPRSHFFGKGSLIWMTWECWLCIPSFARAGFIE